MDFNYELLEQTKKNIKNMTFFKKYIDISTKKYDVIHNYDLAKENAFRKFYKYGGFEGHTWVDILEENMSKVKKVIYQYNNYAELSKLLREVELPELMDIKYTIDDYDVQEEINSEIELCVKSRFVCGKKNIFFENLFEVYKLGGWPCGWNHGKIIVYVPNEK